MAQAPKWARDLTAKVLADQGQYHGIKLDWRRSAKGEESSGTAYPSVRRIVVTAGSSRKDAKLVLLHELAHILTPKHNHDATYWDKAWELYRDYGVNLVYAQKREFTYKAGARAGYKRIIGKRALRIKPFARHRHKWEEIDRQPDWPSAVSITYICRAPWYDTGKECGAHRMDYKHQGGQS